VKDLHKPERGHLVLDDEQRQQIAATGNPAAVDYARQEGAYLVTYWGAPVRTGQESSPRLYLDLSACVATWKRV
jgi:hypothetical protein